jgi:hypothetical protein
MPTPRSRATKPSRSQFSNEGQVRAVAANFGQLLQFNTTGDGVAEFEIFVEAPLQISASDLIL